MDRYQKEYYKRTKQKYVSLEAKYAVESNYSIWDWILEAVGNFSDFKGRARRKEFWYFYLMTSVIMLGTSIIPQIGFLLILLLTLPMLAVTSRRLHDVGRSGLWIVTLVAPWIILLIITIGVGIGSSESTPIIIASVVIIWAMLFYKNHSKSEHTGDSVIKNIVISGLWTSMLFIPFLSLPVILYFLCENTSATENKWGPPAKQMN